MMTFVNFRHEGNGDVFVTRIEEYVSGAEIIVNSFLWISQISTVRLKY